MKIGFNEGSDWDCRDHSIMKDLEYCEAYGFDYIDIQNRCLDAELAAGTVTLEGLRDWFASHHLKVSSYNALCDFNMCASPEEEAEKLDELREAIRRCKYLGTDIIVVVPRDNLTHPATIPEIHQDAVRVLRRMLALCEPDQIRLALEFCGQPSISINRFREAYAIVQEIDHPLLGMTLDHYHFHAMGSEWVDFEQADGSKIFAWHLNDTEDLPVGASYNTYANRLWPGDPRGCMDQQRYVDTAFLSDYTTVPEDSPLYVARSSGESYQLGVVIEEMSPFMSQCAEAVELFAEDHPDVTAQVAICDNDVEKELEAVELFIANGFDAIIMKPYDSQGCSPAVKYCRDAGIPIVAMNNDFQGEQADVFVGSNHIYSGELAAKGMAETLGGRGRVMVLTGSTDQKAAADRLEGIRRVLQDYPAIEIADVQNASWSTELAMDLTASWLSSGASFDGIIACASQMAVGACYALEAAGKKPGEIPVASIDAMKMSLELYREGWVTSDVVQDTWGQGYQSAAAAYALLNGKTLSHYLAVPYCDVRADEVDLWLQRYEEARKVFAETY